MTISDQAGSFALTVASLLLGLQAGGLVDRVAVQLPPALERAWHAREARLAPGRIASATSGSHADRQGLLDGALAGCESVRGDGNPCGPGSAALQPWGVRLLCSGAFGVLSVRFGFGPPLAAAMVATALLIVLALIDHRHRLLPDIFTYALLGFGLLINIEGTFVPLDEALVGAALGYGGLWTFGWLYRSLFRRRGIGLGDLKLLAALGACLGWRAILPITQIAAALALMATLAAMLRCRAVPSMMPYGTYLAGAGWLILVSNFGIGIDVIALAHSMFGPGWCGF